MGVDHFAAATRSSDGSLKCKDVGLRVGRIQSGPHNDIVDVGGVRVGHRTLDDSTHGVHTGVTAVVPPRPESGQPPLRAAVHIINGYGKATGLMELAELGRLETPILLTNTFSIGAVHEGVVRYALREYPELRTGRVTLNPIVAECNDSLVSNMQALAVRPEHAIEAIDASRRSPVVQGSIGAGRGMVMFDYKGGVGTASRVLPRGTVGVLVLANFGRRDELVVAGQPMGRLLSDSNDNGIKPRAAGSVVVVLATDVPTDQLSLHRALRRVQTGLARTGCNVAHASGEIAIGFSCSQSAGAESIPEDELDMFFCATIEATEEAVLNALLNAGAEGAAEFSVPAFPLEQMTRLLP